MTASRRDLRLMLGDAAVLTPNVAAELLPWDDHDAKAWLRAQGLVRVVDGREVVVWGDVVLRIRTGEAPKPKAKRRASSSPWIDPG